MANTNVKLQPELGSLAIEFDNALLQRCKSRHTIAAYHAAVQGWLSYHRLIKASPRSITEAQVASWINRSGGQKLATRKLWLAAITAFCEYLRNCGYILGNPAKNVSVDFNSLTHEQRETKKKIPFTDEEVDRLIKYFKEHNELFWEWAVIVGRDTGLRISDICNLEHSCFNDPGTISVWQEKVNTRVSLPTTPRIVEMIPRLPGDGRFIFNHERSIVINPFERTRLRNYFHEVLQKIGIHGKSFHCLRYAFLQSHNNQGEKEVLARKLVDAMTLEDIRRLAGHGNSHTTKGYL
jgi:integrase